MKPQNSDLLFDLEPTSATKRQRRKSAPTGSVRVAVSVEIPDGQAPPLWLVDFLRAADGAPKRPARPGVESVAKWIAHNVRLRPGSKLTLTAMFGRYRAEALAAGEIPVTRNKFSEAAVKSVRCLHGVAPSNDLLEAGHTRRGFRGLALAPCPAPRCVHPSATEKRLGTPSGQRGQGSPL